MSCYLGLSGECGDCRACGPQPARPLRLVVEPGRCRPGCADCRNLRRTVGQGAISQMAYRSYQVSIEAAMRDCPTGALQLIGG